MLIPKILKSVNLSKNIQLISIFCTSPINPINEFIEIINKEVATAFLMDILVKCTKAGVIKNPPPAPTKPVAQPTAKLMGIKSKKDDFSLGFSAGDFLTFIIDRAAANIITAKNKMIKRFFVSVKLEV